MANELPQTASMEVKMISERCLPHSMRRGINSRLRMGCEEGGVRSNECYLGMKADDVCCGIANNTQSANMPGNYPHINKGYHQGFLSKSPSFSLVTSVILFEGILPVATAFSMSPHNLLGLIFYLIQIFA